MADRPEPSAWVRMTQEDPSHSAAYVQRFRTLAEQGMDLVGEARLVDATLGVAGGAPGSRRVTIASERALSAGVNGYRGVASFSLSSRRAAERCARRG